VEKTLNPSSESTERSNAAIFYAAATYFVHFLALGFSSFPLQTHLRNVLTPTTASLIASIIPLASCLTYFMFRFAERKGWARSPRWMLFCSSIGLALLQLLLGWRMNQTAEGDFVIGPLVDVAICLLMLGCVQSSVMTLLNHICVSTLGDYAYTVRAAGSAGYMVAVMLMGAIGRTGDEIARWHLFIGSAISIGHAMLAFAAWVVLRAEDSRLERQQMINQSAEVLNSTRSVPTDHSKGSPHKDTHSRSNWFELLAIVWLVAICEMSYGLYAHEFMTKTFGNLGYFVFSSAIAVEIALLLVMPFFPQLKAKLLFVGPFGWLLLFSGCIVATQGIASFGLFGIALALNCPFQISTNEHAHRINSSVMGVASMTLAQSLGYVTATIIASIAASFRAGPMLLWLSVLPLSVLALVLAVRKLARKDPALDVDNLGKPSGVAGGWAVLSPKERSDDFESKLGTDHASSNAQDVHIVVLDPLPSGVGVMTKASTDSREFVRSNAHANS